MRSIADLTRLSLLPLLLVALVVPGCSSSDDLPAIKSSQAKSFAKDLAKASCTRIYECLAESMGEDSVEEDAVDMCRTSMENQLVEPLKECERWDKNLAKTCLKDMTEVECPSDGTIRVDTCEELLETCGIEGASKSLAAQLQGR